jgi:hypothetical protein
VATDLTVGRLSGQATCLKAPQKVLELGLLTEVLAHERIVDPKGCKYFEILQLLNIGVQVLHRAVEVVAGKLFD